jgi:hypothetical protein
MRCQICGIETPDELINDGLCPTCDSFTEESAEDRLSPRYNPRGVGNIKGTWVPTENLSEGGLYNEQAL